MHLVLLFGFGAGEQLASPFVFVLRSTVAATSLKKVHSVDSLVVSSAPQLIHSSPLPAEQKGVGI